MNRINVSWLPLLVGCILAAIVLTDCDKTPTGPADTTPPTVIITAPVTGATLSGSTFIRADANDNIKVARVEFYVDGIVASTVSSPAWEYLWDTGQKSDGKHTIFVKAYDDAGNSASSDILTVTITNPYEHTFYNNLFTPISLTVGNQMYTIPVSGSIVVQFPSDPGTFHYHAQTSGQTTDGTQVGLLMVWDNDMNTAEIHSTNLITTSDYFYLKIDNRGPSTGTSVYVNYGLASQTVDMVRLDPGGLYGLGYYHAWSNSNVRMYRNGTDAYSYWEQGTNMFLPFTENQSVTLTNINGAYRKDGNGDAISSSHRPIPAMTVPAVAPIAVPTDCRRDAAVAGGWAEKLLRFR